MARRPDLGGKGGGGKEEQGPRSFGRGGERKKRQKWQPFFLTRQLFEQAHLCNNLTLGTN
jgi:hypothetical protein